MTTAVRKANWSSRRDERNVVRLFIAAPMSAFESQAIYEIHRKRVLAVCDLLEALPDGASAYFAGRDVASTASFNEPTEALRADFTALRDCDIFVLYYPGPVRSSVLVEAGIAIGLRKHCFLACRQVSDLPYLLSNASSVGESVGLPRIDIWEWDSEFVDPSIFVRRIVSALPKLAAV